MRRISIISNCLIFLLLFACSAYAETGTSFTTRARQVLAESSASFWSDDELLVWINDGILDIQARSHANTNKASIEPTWATASEIVREYYLTSNYIGITEILWVDASSLVKGLIHGTVEDVGNVREMGEPVYWYEMGDRIGIYPTMDTSLISAAAAANILALADGDITDTVNSMVVNSVEVNGSDLVAASTTEDMEVYYIERPSTIVGGGTIDLPENYEVPLLMYVVASAWMKDGWWVGAEYLKGEYYKEVERFRRDFEENDQSEELIQ